MSQVTVSQYADQMRTTVAIMLQRLEKAGVHKSAAGDWLSDAEQDTYFTAMSPTAAPTVTRGTLGVRPAGAAARPMPSKAGGNIQVVTKKRRLMVDDEAPAGEAEVEAFVAETMPAPAVPVAVVYPE
jgi:hypothetical protein